MNESDLARRLLLLVNHPDYRPVKPRVLAKRLKLGSDEIPSLKRTIKQLIKSGQLVYAANHLIHSGQTTNRHEMIGTFRRAAGGFGFVRPQGTRPGVGRREDVFIPQGETADAASGDTVRIRLSRRKRAGGDSRWVGAIVAVLRRSAGQFVGTYFAAQGTGWVRIDGTDFPEPLRVGDPGAKRVEQGDKIVVEIVRYPKPGRWGEAIVTEVLGEAGQPGIDTLTIMRQFELPDHFPDDVLDAARAEVEQFDGQVVPPRRDLTSWTVITIDPTDARDFDDAISLERLENGHWLLGVHIADVSHFVRPNSPLDREARDRATSVYLPDRVIPMLPEQISNHLASLQPEEVRFCQSALIEYTAEGVRVATEFCTGAIRSRRRFSYEEVDAFLADRVAWSVKLTPEVYRLVSDMYHLAMILRRRRLDRGSVELNLPEIKLQLDRQGRVAGAKPVTRTESHQVIEEFMLAANESVAERLRDDQIQFLRRIHESPDPMKVATLTEFVRELEIPCEDLTDRFETKRVLAAVEGLPIEQAVNYAVLRAMQKAVYSPDEVGHYALAFDDYCHFTSPIRRYPDLTIHRLMRSVFEGRKSAADLDQLANLGEHCSQREQRAEAAERELIKLKLLHYFSDKVGESLDVVITGVEEFGLFAQGLEIPAEGLISLRSLRDDVYRYDADSHALIGFRLGNRFRLGDLLRVTIARVDLERRELDFRFVERLPHPRAGDSTAAGSGQRKSPSGGGGGSPSTATRRDERLGRRAEPGTRAERTSERGGGSTQRGGRGRSDGGGSGRQKRRRGR